MDIAGAMTAEECMEELGLDRIKDKAWHITLVFFAIFINSQIMFLFCLINSASNAITGSGVDEGIEWLCTAISGRHK